MATQGGDYTRGEMIIEEHEKTYAGFLKFAKWGSLYLGAMILFLVLWFCTPAHFLGGLITAVIVVVLGVLALGEKKRPATKR